MKYKIYTEGSEFILENQIGYKHRGSLKEVQVIPVNNTKGSPRFKIKGLAGWNPNKFISLNEVGTEEGTEMTQESLSTIQEEKIVAVPNYVVKESVWATMTDAQKKGKTFDIIAG